MLCKYIFLVHADHSYVSVARFIWFYNFGWNSITNQFKFIWIIVSLDDQIPTTTMSINYPADPIKLQTDLFINI